VPELREVFEMTTRKIEPDLHEWEEQERRQRSVARNRKIGAIALSAALAVVAALLVMNAYDATDQGREPNRVTGQPATLPSKPSVYLFDLETQQATRVAAIVSGWAGIAVSPDGTTVAYQGTDPEGKQVVYVANVDGTNIRGLEKTAATGPEMVAPQFSPDGSQIVYQAKDYGNWVGDLFLVDVATGETTRLTHFEPVASGLWDMAPTFSPDGQTVLFTRPSSNYVNQSWDLWSVPATGGRPRPVLRDAALGRLSPDGGTIAYFKPSPEDPLDGDLWLADADGTDARRLARGDLLAPRWSPDGTKIAYVDRGRGGTYVVDVTTGGTSRVLDGAYWPEWIDEHTWIVAPDPL
jgi:Tol biopolymer transport system component